jgi:hypothetical protein
MLGQQRALKLLSALVVALLSGGAAWAATGGDLPVPSDPTTDSTVVTTTTDSSTTTTEAPTTTEEPTTTTSTTAEPSDTDEPEAPKTPDAPSDSTDCKPGWGYGDKNHCHSVPPGLSDAQHERTGTDHESDDSADEHDTDVDADGD